MLHVRLRLLLNRQQPDRNFPWPGGRAFVTEQPTRLVLPSHIEAVADAAAAAADFVKRCGAGDDTAFGIDIAIREAVTNAVVHANRQDESKKVAVTFSSSPGALEIEVSDQ